MQQKKLFFYKFILIAVSQVYFSSIAVASQEAGSKIAEVATTITGNAMLKVLPVLTLTYQVGDLGWQTVKYFFPTEEEKAQALCTTDRLQSVQMFEKFTTCLIDNPKGRSTIGEFGIPKVCEISARELVKKGAAKEVNDMIHVYRSDRMTFILKK